LPLSNEEPSSPNVPIVNEYYWNHGHS
jgi:hypothetical protein